MECSPVYSLSIRTRAFRLIMGEVGGMNSGDLAAAVVASPWSDSYDLLKAVVLCLWVAIDITYVL